MALLRNNCENDQPSLTHGDADVEDLQPHLLPLALLLFEGLKTREEREGSQELEIVPFFPLACE